METAAEALTQAQEELEARGMSAAAARLSAPYLVMLKTGKSVAELPGEKGYAQRARTTYERRVDFKHAEAQLNASETRTRQRLMAQLRQTQDSLIAWTQATTLDSDTVRYLAVATLPEFQRTLQDMFEQAWTHGRDAGVRELPRKVKKKPTVQDVKTFAWDYCPSWSDEMEWSEIVLDYAAHAGKFTSQQLAQLIVGNSAEDMGGIDVALAKEGDYWVKQTVPLAALKGMDDAGVDPADAKQGGAIVVGARGTIYDGRHRAAAARAAGQTHIEAYVPFAEWDESKHPRQPKGDEKGGEWASLRPGDKIQTKGGEEAFHGTPGKNLSSILKKGILSGRLKNFEDTAGGVYIAKDKEVATMFGSFAAQIKEQKEFALLRIVFPPGVTLEARGFGWTFNLERVKREWIVGAEVYDAETGDKKRTIKMSEDDGYYLPLSMDQARRMVDLERDYANAFEPVEAMKAFENRAWMIKDVIDSRLQDQVRFELFEHLKGGRTMGDTIQRLRDIFEPWVGDPSKIRPGSDILSAPRLENIVRTETTWAYNQGRLAVGDSTDDYVVGYQFTAILDERTTETCQTADGLVLRKDDSTTIQLTPPLHYQCRSMLVYVTVDDAPIEWSDDKQIDAAVALIQPGFK